MSKELTTTNISRSHQQVLKKLARKFELSQVDFLNGAVEYFRKTGINPTDELTSPKEEMAALNKRLDQVIRFMRVHERDKLSPLLDSLIIIDRRLKDKLEFLLTKEDLDNIESKIKNSFEDFRGVLSDNKESMEKITNSISTANSNYVRGYKHHNENLGKVIQLVELLFTLLMNKRLGGYNKEDIQNFKDAISQIRQA